MRLLHWLTDRHHTVPARARYEPTTMTYHYGTIRVTPQGREFINAYMATEGWR